MKTAEEWIENHLPYNWLRGAFTLPPFIEAIQRDALEAAIVAAEGRANTDMGGIGHDQDYFDMGQRHAVNGIRAVMPEIKK